MRPLLPVLAMIPVAALAGCLGSDAPVTPTDTPPPGTPPDDGGNETNLPGPSEPGDLAPVVQTFEGSVAGAGDPAIVQVRVGGENGFEFDVGEGALGIVVEVAWEGSPLDLYVEHPPEHCEGTDALGFASGCAHPDPDTDGESPARIVVVDPALLNLTGAWSAAMFPRASPTEQAFTMYVSVFYAAPPEEAYTAIPAGPTPAGAGAARAPAARAA